MLIKAAPSPLMPNNGFIVPNLDFVNAKGLYSIQKLDISASLSHAIAGIDTAQLCIVSGEQVWCVHADILCLSDDGSVFPAALYALTEALKDLVIDGKILNLDVLPIAVSIGILPPLLSDLKTTEGIQKCRLLVDPTEDEESLVEGVITIVLNAVDSTILSLHKTGRPIGKEDLIDSIAIATAYLK